MYKITRFGSARHTEILVESVNTRELQTTSMHTLYTQNYKRDGYKPVTMLKRRPREAPAGRGS